jgi:hypothetical protein
MTRDTTEMIASTRLNAERVMQAIAADGRRPAFGLYIDCAGRTAELSQTDTEEASEIQEVCRKWNTPLLGFYSGVELAPCPQETRGLDWTGVFLVLAEKQTS